MPHTEADEFDDLLDEEPRHDCENCELECCCSEEKMAANHGYCKDWITDLFDPEEEDA